MQSFCSPALKLLAESPTGASQDFSVADFKAMLVDPSVGFNMHLQSCYLVIPTDYQMVEEPVCPSSVPHVVLVEAVVRANGGFRTPPAEPGW